MKLTKKNQTNPNTSFLSSGRGVLGFFAFYILAVLGFRFAVFLCGLGTVWGWTFTYLVHTLVTFFTFHWVKGTPFEGYDQDKYGSKTFWEQLHAEDEGWDLSKKFLTAAPIFFYLVCLHYSYYDFFVTLLNTTALAFNIIPKLSSFHKKRLFGINAD